MKSITFVILIAAALGGFQLAKKYLFPDDHALITRLFEDLRSDSAVKYKENALLAAKRANEISNRYFSEDIQIYYLSPSRSRDLIVSGKEDLLKKLTLARARLDNFKPNFETLQIDLGINSATAFFKGIAEFKASDGKSYLDSLEIKAELEKNSDGWKIKSAENTRPLGET